MRLDDFYESISPVPGIREEDKRMLAETREYLKVIGGNEDSDIPSIMFHKSHGDNIGKSIKKVQ